MFKNEETKQAVKTCKRIDSVLTNISKICSSSVITKEDSSSLIKSMRYMEMLRACLQKKYRLSRKNNYNPIEEWSGNIGQKYLVEYKDLNYPCDCPCHLNKNILHVVECCIDEGYSKTMYFRGLFKDSKFTPILYYYLFEDKKGQEKIVPAAQVGVNYFISDDIPKEKE